MSEEKEVKQFSVNLYYTKAEDKITILDHKRNELGSFIQQYDQKKKVSIFLIIIF